MMRRAPAVAVALVAAGLAAAQESDGLIKLKGEQISSKPANVRRCARTRDSAKPM